jgi:diaminobutyrate-2-oxoglutarate transaminase
MRTNRKIHFCGPTGANTVDAAIKLAKTATGRSEIVTFRGGFHGTTHLSMSVTGLVDQRQPIGNTMPGVHFATYSYCSRCPVGLTRDTCQVNCATTVETQFGDSNGGMLPPAAVLLELVQGEGGVIPAQQEFVTRVAEAARRVGALLIVDEVQTGCGRTGTWFAFEQYGIEPDIICASKALSGVGTPLGIIIYRDDIDCWQPGAHTGTFRGNQPGFAAGVETIRIFKRDRVLDNVRARGKQVESILKPLEVLPTVREVRGLGLLWGIELHDPETGAPATRLAREVQRQALESGLIVERGGREDGVVRLLPPLNVSELMVDRACTLLAQVVRRCSAATMLPPVASELTGSAV